MATPKKIRIPAIRAARIKRGLSQEEVAFAIGCTRSMITEMENGKRGLGRANKLMLASLYEVSYLEIAEMIQQAKNLARMEREK